MVDDKQQDPLKGDELPLKAEGVLTPSREARKKREFRVFIFLTVLLAPLLSIAIVGGYGFLIWISHMIFGPPAV